MKQISNMKIVKYKHHGVEVSVPEPMKGRHRAHCLCWKGCKHFKPDDRDNNCEIANANYENCIKYNVVLPVWECPKYEK